MVCGKTEPTNGPISFSDKLKMRYDPMIEGVRWTERYHRRIEKVWNYIPNWLAQILATIAVFLLASGIQGEWILIAVHLLKHIQYNKLLSNEQNISIIEQLTTIGDENGSLVFHIFASCIGSYAIYFGIGGFLHWYFYVRQRDKSHEWKCQPTKFLSPQLEINEIAVGTISLFCLSAVTGTVSWYAANGGTLLKVYYRCNEYGWLWFFLQVPIVFMYQDYLTYWTHRMYHNPRFYERFHKMHHKYKQPTAFSVTAIHPVEALHVQSILISPIFLIPVHWALFYGTLLYVYYHGIIDHSGVAFKAFWWQPWQPDAIFHDNHHQYFHVNYGFNMFLWDKLHGTFRRKDRVYTEEIFSGKGKAFNEVSADVLANDLAERKSENPHAYRSNQNDNDISDLELEIK